MDGSPRAILFSSWQTDDPFPAMLRACGLEPVKPNEKHDGKPMPVLIVINHSLSNTLTISTNLRKDQNFRTTPILALLDRSEFKSAQLNQLEDFGVACVPRTITSQAMGNFVREHVLKPLEASQIAYAVQPSPNKVEPTQKKPEPAKQQPTQKPVTPLPVTAPEFKSDGKSPAIKPAVAANKKPDAAPPKSPVATPPIAAGQTTKSPPPANQPHQGTKKEATKETGADNYPASPKDILRAIPPSPEITKNGHECEHCSRWMVRREDLFCARCGKELAQLSPLEPIARFSADGKNERYLTALLELKNPGQNPVYLDFKVTTGDQAFAERLKFRPKNAELNTGRGQIQLILDTLGLNPIRDHRAELQIVANLPGKESRFLTRSIELLIEGQAIPDAILHKDNCDYVAGAENKCQVKIFNKGSGGLTLKRLLLDDKPLSFNSPGRITKPELVEFILPKLDLTVGAHTKKLVCEFDGHPSVELPLKIRVVNPPRLVALPAELNLGTKSVLRQHPLSLKLHNTGGEELVIENIESPEWLDCRPRKLKIPPGNIIALDLLLRGNAVPPGLQGEGKQLQAAIRIHSNCHRSPDYSVPVRLNPIQPKPYDSFIGIDFGTTGSCVAVLDRRQEMETVALDGEEKIMPTVLYFKHSDFILSGREAQRHASIAPESTVTAIKRVLGQKDKNRKIAGLDFSPTELTAEVIKELLRRTEIALIEMGILRSPDLAIVTRPVEFGDREQALVKACQLAGLDVENSGGDVVISEAHAVALYYLSRKSELADRQPLESLDSGVERVLVFDFGGGSLDCELVEVSATAASGRLVTKAQYGNDHLGGEDIDWELFRLLKNKIRQMHPDFDANCLEEDDAKIRQNFRTAELERLAMRVRNDFKRLAEQTKIALVTAESVEIEVGPVMRLGASSYSDAFVGQGAKFKLSVTQQDLETAMKGILDRAAEVVITICNNAKVAPEMIQTILHAGRTSHLPLVRARINALLPNAKDHSSLIPPKECVALGAAFWGKIKNDPDSPYEVVSAANLLVHNIGRLRQAPIGGAATDGLFETIIPAGTQLPFEKEISMPRKDVLTLRLAENRSHREIVRGNLGIRPLENVSLKFHNLNQPEVKVIFRINTDRILEIYAEHNQQSHKIPLNED